MRGDRIGEFLEDFLAVLVGSLDGLSVVLWSVFFISKGLFNFNEGEIKYGVACMIFPIILALIFIRLRMGVDDREKISYGALFSINITAIIIASQW